MLSLVHKTVRYGVHTALDDVTLTIPEGARMAIVGPNGSGKSTLLRALIPGAPCVLVPQQTPEDLPILARDYVMLARTPRLSPWHRPVAADEAAVTAALEAVQASSLATRRMDALSGGERRRMALAFALATEAPCLVLDEPVAQLDLYRRRALYDLLFSLHRTLVVALHELEDARRFDRVILLGAGCVVADGAPDEVLQPEILSQVYSAVL